MKNRKLKPPGGALARKPTSVEVRRVDGHRINCGSSEAWREFMKIIQVCIDELIDDGFDAVVDGELVRPKCEDFSQRAS
jgi:hypothetical protein